MILDTANYFPVRMDAFSHPRESLSYGDKPCVPLSNVAMHCAVLSSKCPQQHQNALRGAPGDTAASPSAARPAPAPAAHARSRTCIIYRQFTRNCVPKRTACSATGCGSASLFSCLTSTSSSGGSSLNPRVHVPTTVPKRTACSASGRGSASCAAPPAPAAAPIARLSPLCL